MSPPDTRREPAMSPRGEMLRITLSMAVACALGAAVLGGVYVATDRYQRAARLATEGRAIGELLGLDRSASVLEVRQYLSADGNQVVYVAHPFGAAGPERRLRFALDGRPVSAGGDEGGPAAEARAMRPLGRLFLARRDGAVAGFVVEGSARGYKNRIRFMIGLTKEFEIAGVRVVEHEEDPGLGAEVAAPAFEGQFVGRPASGLPALGVTRDPMPEDWRAALAELERTPVAAWRERHLALLARERSKPIYAVTGATISSRALTDGVRATVDHFRRRWALIAPYLGADT